MTTITIPKNLIKEKDLILLPRKKYEEFIQFVSEIKEFAPTAEQKKALKNAEKNLQKGKTMSYYELAKKLGFAN